VTGDGAEAVPFEVRVRWEIWESLVSMLRVYAIAAAERGEFTVTATYAAAWVTHKSHVLGLSLNPIDGAATWRLAEQGLHRQGGFQVLESGMLGFPGEEKQLDEAAIDWIEELARAGRSIKVKKEEMEADSLRE
jgi:hypothetical protein